MENSKIAYLRTTLMDIKYFFKQAGHVQLFPKRKKVENDMFETSKLFKGRMMYFKKCH